MERPHIGSVYTQARAFPRRPTKVLINELPVCFILKVIVAAEVSVVKRADLRKTPDLNPGNPYKVVVSGETPPLSRPPGFQVYHRLAFKIKKVFLVGQPGFEPGTPSPPDLYANQLRYCPTKKTCHVMRARRCARVPDWKRCWILYHVLR